MSGGLIDYFDDLDIAECLATMRSRMCVKRHGVVAMDRYFKGVCRKMTREDGGGRDDPATYMPPRRLWSRVGLKARKVNDRSVYNKLAIMRHVRWVILNGKLDEYEWGRRFAEFAARIRARVERGDFNFEMPVSFAVEKPSKGTRFVTSFLNLEDKVILRQVAKYLRKAFDAKLSPHCYSFREDGAVDHSLAVRALIDYRANHKDETLWVAECDIRKFFDVIDHRVAWRAFERLARGAKVDPKVKKAVKGYLAAYTSLETLLKGCKPKCYAKCEEYVRRIREALGERNGDVGVPQGGAISMLIANWVLDVADQRVERWGDANLFYARFCDDIVIVHPDREKCRAARDRYLRALERLLLPYHPMAKRIPYGKAFYEAKSKGPYCWRELRKPDERGVSPWVSFLGNQIRFDGEVRVRQDSIDRHVVALRAEQRKSLGLMYAARREGSGITMRKGTKAHPVTQGGVVQAMMKSMIAKGVGYLRSGTFAATGDMCWMSAFPDICGRACERQLRQLDAVRANILYPLQKMSGSRHYIGRPASYCGFLDRVARPAVGGARRWRVGRPSCFQNGYMI
ncbi:MAG: hypothetical protein MJ138_07075 [Kiritimatiellae bacterium]|nr:hypothetical protein [Kiritimatiellia bacterium]